MKTVYVAKPKQKSFKVVYVPKSKQKSVETVCVTKPKQKVVKAVDKVKRSFTEKIDNIVKVKNVVLPDKGQFFKYARPNQVWVLKKV